MAKLPETTRLMRLPASRTGGLYTAGTEDLASHTEKTIPSYANLEKSSMDSDRS